MGEVKQANFRVNQETADAFRRFCEEQGMSQAQGFSHIMQVVEYDRAKTVTPERLVEIEEFEKSLKHIMAAYLTSIEINNGAEARIREQFASALERKDRAISDLQAKAAALQEAKVAAEESAARAAQIATQATKGEETARDQAETAAKLAAEKDNTIATLADKLAIAENKAAGYDELKTTAESAIREIERLKEEHKREVSEIKKDMERKVSDTKKDAALELANAVAAKEKEMQTQIREIDRENAKLQARIEALGGKL